MALTIGEEPGEGEVFMALQCARHGTVLITVSVMKDEDFTKIYHCPACGAALKGWTAQGSPS